MCKAFLILRCLQMTEQYILAFQKKKNVDDTIEQIFYYHPNILQVQCTTSFLP